MNPAHNGYIIQIPRETDPRYVASLVVSPKHRAGQRIDKPAQMRRRFKRKMAVEIAYRLLMLCDAPPALLQQVEALVPTLGDWAKA